MLVELVLVVQVFGCPSWFGLFVGRVGSESGVLVLALNLKFYCKFLSAVRCQFRLEVRHLFTFVSWFVVDYLLCLSNIQRLLG